MGHHRLGRLPASKKWKEIVCYLAEADVEVGQMADATAVAAEDSLALWEKDPAFIEALWLLVKIPQAAREKEFAKALRRLGLMVPDDPTITDVVVGLDAAIESVQRRNPGAVTNLSEMARHAAVAAFTASRRSGYQTSGRQASKTTGPRSTRWPRRTSSPRSPSATSRT